MAETDAGTGLLSGAGAEPGEHWSNDYELEGVEDDGRQTLRKFDSVEKSLVGHINAEKLLGRSIALPKDDATPEEKTAQMNKVYAKLDVPATAEEYTFKLPENIPAGMEPSAERLARADSSARSMSSSTLSSAFMSDSLANSRAWSMSRWTRF